MRTGTIIAAALSAGVVAYVASKRKTPVQIVKDPKPVDIVVTPPPDVVTPPPDVAVVIPPAEAKINDIVDVAPGAIPAELAAQLLATQNAVGGALTKGTVRLFARSLDTQEFMGYLTSYAWTRPDGTGGESSLSETGTLLPLFSPKLILAVKRPGANPNQALIEQARTAIFEAGADTPLTITPERLANLIELSGQLSEVGELTLADGLAAQYIRLQPPTPPATVGVYATCSRPASEFNRGCPIYPTPSRGQANPKRLTEGTRVRVLEMRRDGWWLVRTPPEAARQFFGYAWYADLKVQPSDRLPPGFVLPIPVLF